MAKQAKDKLGAYLLLSLKNGKVYVGQLVNATFDPNETARMLVISIDLSGFREKESHLVRFDKNYREHIQNPIDRSILIPFSEVVSISPFDFGVHQRFVESGITLLGQARNPT